MLPRVDPGLSVLLYALACVAVPALWGLLMYRVFGWLRNRTKKGGGKDEPPPVDYSI